MNGATRFALLALLSLQLLHEGHGFSISDAIKSDSQHHTYTSATELFADIDNTTPAAKRLLERQSHHQTPFIQKVTDKIFVAVDYALGFSIWLVTPQNTIIVVDTPEGYPAALKMRADMRAQPEIGNKSISTIVYTIFHADHTFGARAFVEDPANNGKAPTIIAHKNMRAEGLYFDTYNFFKFPRAVQMFGLALPPSAVIDPFAKLQLTTPLKIEFYPNEFIDIDGFGEKHRRVIDGLDIDFMYTPGYTEDHMVLWLPNEKAVLAADNFYDAFPNLYTIRGEPARDVMRWAESTRLVKELGAECLVPSHIKAICGSKIVRETLELYSDAIQYVHDQTVRMMAKGYTSDVIADTLTLPAVFSEKQYLEPIYGSTANAVRAIVDHFVGWFSGQLEDLMPLNRYDRASYMVKYFTEKGLLAMAKIAYKKGDYKFALELATHVWLNSGKQDTDALYYRSNAAKRIAENTVNSPMRNFMLSAVAKEWNLIDHPMMKALIKVNSRQQLLGLHLDGVFKLMQYHVNSEMTIGADAYMMLNLVDDKSYELHIRNNILLVKENTSGPNDKLTVTTSINGLKGVLTGMLTVSAAVTPAEEGQQPAMAIANGSVQSVEHFLSYFDFNDEV